MSSQLEKQDFLHNNNEFYVKNIVTTNKNENNSNTPGRLNLLAESLEIKKIKRYSTAISYFWHFDRL